MTNLVWPTKKNMCEVTAELPVQNNLYKELSYWNDRFQNEDSYDWFMTFEKFKGIMQETLGRNHQLKILMLGKHILQ